MAKLKVTLVTPQKAINKGEADMVVAPSVMGQVGILPDHRPLLANLVEGVVELKNGANTERFAVAGGFIEVDRNIVNLLVEAAERPEDIDRNRAQKALAEAEAELKKLSPGDEAYAAAEGRAKRARARLSIASSDSNTAFPI